MLEFRDIRLGAVFVVGSLTWLWVSGTNVAGTCFSEILSFSSPSPGTVLKN